MNIFRKIKTKYSVSLLTAFFIALNFVGFVLPKKAIAQTACNYFVDFKANKSQATPSDVVTYIATVIRSGDLSKCSDGVNLNLVIKQKTGELIFPFGAGDFSEILGLGSTVRKSYNLDLSKFDRANLSKPNVIEAKVNVYEKGVIGKTVTESSYFEVGVSGSLGTSGAVKMNVYFQPNAAEYKKGDKISVNAHITEGLSGLASSVSNIAYIVYVNGTKIGQFTKPLSDFQSGDQYYNNLEISDNNKFGNGINTIKVELVQTNSLKLGEGTATLKAAGLLNNVSVAPDPNSNTGGGNPGGGGGPGGGNGGNGNGAIDCSVPGNCLQSPIPAENLVDFFIIVIKGFLAIMGVFAVVFIIVGGFQMVVAAGNEEAITKAKKTITWAVLGMVVALLAFSIIAIVQSLLQVNVPDAPKGTQNTEKVFLG